MFLLKILKSIAINYVLWFPAFVISYIFWSAIWALNIAGNLYEQSDPVVFLTDFIPPFVSPHYDHYLNGGNEVMVMRLWYLFTIAILVTSISIYLLIKKCAEGLVAEIERVPK